MLISIHLAVNLGPMPHAGLVCLLTQGHVFRPRSGQIVVGQTKRKIMVEWLVVVVVYYCSTHKGKQLPSSGQPPAMHLTFTFRPTQKSLGLNLLTHHSRTSRQRPSKHKGVIFHVFEQCTRSADQTAHTKGEKRDRERGRRLSEHVHVWMSPCSQNLANISPP